MKITKATFKSFIKKNKKTLQVWIQAEFDGMTDCVQSIRGSFEPMQDSEEWPEHNLGIKGIWLVNGGRDYFSKFEENGMVGIKYFNSCGIIFKISLCNLKLKSLGWLPQMSTRLSIEKSIDEMLNENVINIL